MSAASDIRRRRSVNVDRVVTLGGRYELVRKLAEGGMAELWLARLTGSAGFAKLVAVKRILPRLARSPRFADMFLDEGRLAADMRHPNIVQVLEVGVDDGELFIVMELLDGLDAGRLMSRTLARGERLPLGVAVQIVADAAAGLAYAHDKTSLDGERLEIIHRDVSPQNLFITVDGHTKVVDFGIAKARSQTTMTEAGTLKGKCGYMSPEQVCGDPVDQRADQFALGVVLWELVAGQRLFRRDTDVDTLRAVLNHEVPPLAHVVDGVPEELERIIARSLHEDPRERFPSCDDLADALDAFLQRTVDGVPIRRGLRAVGRIVRARLAEGPSPSEQANVIATADKTLPQRVMLGSARLDEATPNVDVIGLDGPPPTLAPSPPLVARDRERRAVKAALELADERVVDVGPLAVPAPGADAAEILRSPAVRLLVSSAGIDTGLVSSAEAASLADVARNAGGLPSSLLLAGRWLVERRAIGLPDEANLPTGEEKLFAMLDGGLEHLDASTRALLLHLAVHVGPLDADFVERLVPGHAHGDGERALQRLRDAAVLVDDALAPALRERALDELAALGDLLPARRRHAEVMAAVAEREVRRLDAPARDEAEALLERLRADVEDALEILLAHDDLDDVDDARVLWLALALDAIATREGSSQAQLRLLDEALGHASRNVDPQLRARARGAGRPREARRPLRRGAQELRGGARARRKHERSCRRDPSPQPRGPRARRG
jgi:serine/threonine-protein kinase